MDSVSEIKSRLPIDQLVAQYCQLQKKGRNLVALCPFHQDSRPSLLVSPDKGIAYCFACQQGGDIFTFYQQIEGVDFVQALKDLAERAGVTLDTESMSARGPKKDEKERARDCLLAAANFYQEELKKNQSALAYLQKRGVTSEEIQTFHLGYAPDSFSATYDHLLKLGFSRTEIQAAGMAAQREIDGKSYDRFRHRLMFPIYEAQGGIVGFGGRTLGDDPAKYINSSDGILYHKSNVLFGYNFAKDAMREKETAIVVEGYFDVLACHRVGVTNVVAASGTAFTEQHAKLLKRYCQTVSLCLDQDNAGRDAAERAFGILCGQDIHVQAIVLPWKDPADGAEADAPALKTLLEAEPIPFVTLAIRELGLKAELSPLQAKEAFEHLARLISLVPNRLERSQYLETAKILSVRHGLKSGDLEHMVASVKDAVPIAKPVTKVSVETIPAPYSATEIALGILLLHPTIWELHTEMIEPDDPFSKAIYSAIRDHQADPKRIIKPEFLPEEHRRRFSILLLYCEDHGWTDWSESTAAREARKNCQFANREMLHFKEKQIKQRLLAANMQKDTDQVHALDTEYQQVLKLLQKAA